MRTIKMIGLAALSALALTSTASAANWDPQNTVLHGHGTLTLRSGSATVTCAVTTNVKATGDLATTTNSAGTPAGPTFSNCSNNLGLNPTVVTSSSAWNATATSTTVVDVTNGNAVINIGSGACVITASGAAVPGNTWNNASSTLTANSTAAFPITRSGFCLGTTTTATMAGSVTVPGASIT